ncbi:MAG: pyridoxamine 5'-phosphate oxidase family protein [Bacillota bacterium]
MRRKEKLVTDVNILHKVINEAQVCRIGLVNGDLPYVIPLNFGFDGKYVYFHCATDGQKVEILKKNNNVCLEFEQDISIIEAEKPCNWGVRYLSVVVHGTVEMLVDSGEKTYGLNQIIRQYKTDSQLYNFSPNELKSVLVYKVTPREIIGKVSGMLS